MSTWDMLESDDERHAKTLQVIQELIAVLRQERKAIVGFEPSQLVPIHLRKVELITELQTLRAPAEHAAKPVTISVEGGALLPSPLVQQVQVAAHRLEIEARINALLCGEASAALARRLGVQTESSGTYNKKALRSMNIPSRSKRAA